jgi:6-phosphofructokinase 2
MTSINDSNDNESTISVKPISILTLNPAVDISYELEELVSNKKSRSIHTKYYAGGNGINLARALTELNVPASCFSIIGGEIGRLLLRLLGDSLKENHHYVEVDGDTRLNAILQRKNPPAQYEIDSHGPEIQKEVVDQVLNSFTQASQHNIAVLTGSIPPGVNKNVYECLSNELGQNGTRVIIDANGEELINAMHTSPYLLRLNRYVLESIVNRRLEQPEDVAEAAREIQKKGPKKVCVTLGQQGAVLTCTEHSYYCNAPKVRIKSTVGCGDSTMAGIIASIYHHETPEEMLRMGIICGSATASHPGTELFEIAEINKDYDDLDVIKMDI